MLEKQGTVIKGSFLPTDLRPCVLCNELGEGDSDGPGRYGKPQPDVGFVVILCSEDARFVNYPNTCVAHFVYNGHKSQHVFEFINVFSDVDILEELYLDKLTLLI